MPDFPQRLRGGNVGAPERTEEDAISYTPYPWPPHYEPPAPRIRNGWAEWSLGIAVVALVYGVPVEYEATRIHVTHSATGYPSIAPVPSGPIWLQGRFLCSWWGAAALLLILLAVAAGVRSLTLIRSGAEHGLGIAVSGLVIASVALLIGNAIVFGFLGIAASIVVYGIYTDSRRPQGAVSTNAPAAAEAWESPQGWARTVAILALGAALLGPLLAWASFSLFVLGLLLSFVAIVVAMVALRRTRATGEAGRGWAISAIVVASSTLVQTAFFLLLNWLLSPLFATS